MGVVPCPPWRCTMAAQVAWMREYILRRYGGSTPRPYASGGILPAGPTLAYNGTGRPEEVSDGD